MTRRPALLALVAVAVAASSLPAQPPKVPLKDVLTADDIRRVGERVRALQGPVDSQLLDALNKLIKANPGLTPEQLAAKLLQQQRPDLLEPQNAAKLQRAAEELAAKAGTPTPAPPGPPTAPPVTPGPPTAPSAPMPPEVAPGGPPQVPQPAPPQVAASDPPGKSTPPTPAQVEPPLTSPAAGTTPTVPVPTPAEGQTPAVESRPPPGATPALPPATTEQEAQFRAATGWWEKNVGPINDSPAVKDMLAEFIKGAGAAEGESPLASLLKGLKGEGGSGFKEFAKGVLPEGFQFPSLGLNRPTSLPTLPTAPVAPLERPSFDLGDSWAPVAAGAAIAVVAFATLAVLPWWRARAGGPTPTPVPGLGPWPLDPRSVTDRDTLVRAFDYLSVLTLGGAARQYNHVTIASELRRRVPAADDIADELGRHYEAARYTPPGEPVAAADLAAARAALCRLAGVPA